MIASAKWSTPSKLPGCSIAGYRTCTPTSTSTGSFNTMKKSTLASILLLMSFSTVSQAQYRGALGSTWNNPVSSLSNMQMWNNINGMARRRAMLKTSLRKYGCSEAQMNAMPTENELMLALSRKSCSTSGSGAGSAQASASQRSSPASVRQAVPPITFRPTGERILLPQIVAAITQDASEQKALVQLLGGAIDQFEAAERVKGFEYDLASAMSFFASISIHMQDPRTEINSSGGDALTFALRESLGPKAASISNSDKQQLYEALLSFGMLFALSARNADANTLAQLKQTSAEVSRKLMGLDVSKYRFSADGLVSVK